MKIVHYVRSIREEEGGLVRAVLDMSRALAACGHSVSLCSRYNADLKSSVVGETPRLSLINVKGSLGPCLTRGGLHQLEGTIAGADIVHLHQIWDPSCAQVARLAERLSVPYVVTLHGMLDCFNMNLKPLKKRAYLTMLGRRVLQSAAKVHCTADFERDQSCRWFGSDNVAVMPYVTDLTPYQDLPGPALAKQSYEEVFSASRPVVLFLSRLDPKKRLDRLIRAAASLARQGVAFELAIAGTGKEGYENRLSKLSRRLGIADRIHFLGFVRGRNKLSLYEAADLFVLPTDQENWGLVLTESLACGTPVITTKGTDIWRELESTGGALIVDKNPEAIAQGITRLLGDAGLRRKMGALGRQWVLDNLDMARVAGCYVDLYASVTSAAGPGSPV